MSFLPGNQTNKQNEDKERKQAYQRIEDWSLEAIPSKIRDGVIVSVREVQCGDPDCAPIDTAVAILFPSGGRGMMGIPLEAKDVTQDILLEGFPTQDVLAKWYNGEEADWPPFDDNDETDFEPGEKPQLRFENGSIVECRIGPDPVTGWARGKIVQLWYREPNWPVNAWAPYQVELDDGRLIYAPADLDHVIRLSSS